MPKEQNVMVNICVRLDCLLLHGKINFKGDSWLDWNVVQWHLEKRGNLSLFKGTMKRRNIKCSEVWRSLWNMGACWAFMEALALV